MFVFHKIDIGLIPESNVCNKLPKFLTCVVERSDMASRLHVPNYNEVLNLICLDVKVREGLCCPQR